MLSNAKNLTVKVQYFNNFGSGFIYNPPNEAYSYIITAKHCLRKTEETDVEDIRKEDIEKDNIIIWKARKRGKVERLSEILDVFLHKDSFIDIAILKIERIEGIENAKFMTPSSKGKYKVYVNGYPFKIRNTKTPLKSVKSELRDLDDGELELRVIDTLDSFNSEPLEAIKGLSGGPIFRIFDDNIFIIGIQTRVNDDEMSFRDIYGESLSEIIELMKYNNLICLEYIYTEEQLSISNEYINLEKWEERSNRNISNWVDIESSNKIIESVKNHFMSDNENNILYIVGASGTGKSRAVLEACLRNKWFDKVIYFEKYTKECLEHISKLKSSSSKFYIIIDDVFPEDWETINREFLGKYNHLRIINIGVQIGSTRVYEENIISKEKASKEEIEELLIKNKIINKDIIDKIISLSEYDLRLVILLKDFFSSENIENINYGNMGNQFTSIGSIFKRILELYKDEIGDIDKFKEIYSKFCLFMDIGIKGEYSKELKILCEILNIEEIDANKIIKTAEKCSLGKVKQTIFEPYPQAMANYIFENESWGLIHLNINEFIEALDDTMKKRFINRVELISQEIRNEVEVALATWFQSTFETININELEENERYKTLVYYSKFSSENSLNWILRRIKEEKNLIRFGGKSRRHIIWLIESLVLFKENFYLCEEILFYLSQNENEFNISNNSQNIWCGLFLIMFSNTELNFLERSKLYFKRLDDSSDENFTYMLNVIKSTLKSQFFRTVPPKVVGGKIVPKSWNPKTNIEFENLLSKFYDDIFEKILYFKIKNNFKAIKIIEVIIQMLPQFSSTMYFDKVIEFLINKACLDIKEKMLLRENLQSILLYGKQSEEKVNKYLEQIKLDGIKGEFIEIVNSDYWNLSRDNDNKFENKVINLAQKLIEKNFEFGKHYDVLNNSIMRGLESFNYLIFQVGKLDSNDIYFDYIKNLIESNKYYNISEAYLRGKSSSEIGLTDKVLMLFELINDKNQLYILNLTLNVDISKRGLARILGIIKSMNCKKINVINLGRAEWRNIIDKIDCISILEALYGYKNIESIKNIFYLNYYWKDSIESSDKRFELILNTFKVIEEIGSFNDAWIWEENFDYIPEKYYMQKIDILLNTFKKVSDFDIECIINKKLKDLAKKYSRNMIDKVGEMFLNENMFKLIINSNKGIFESFNFEDVKRWLDENGEKAAIAIARHLNSPNLGEEKAKLTYYILEKFEYSDKVFNEFLMGRNSGEVINLSQRIEKAADLKLEFEKFLKHPNRRIRSWAEFEIEELNRDIKWKQDIQIKEEREH